MGFDQPLITLEGDPWDRYREGGAGASSPAGLLLFVLVLCLAACRTGDKLPTPDANQTPGATQPASGAVPVVHSPVEVVIQPEAGSARLVQAIDGAEKSLRMKVYLVTEDDVVDALKRAAQRGVDTRVMIEPNPEGGGDTNRVAAAELAAAGVQVRDTPSAFRLSHEKSLVVDDRVAFIMTHNLTRSSFAKNREFEAISEDKAVVEEVTQVFDADWERREPDLSQALLVWSPINSRSRITALIDGAGTTLDLYQASVLDDELNERLLAAVKRGVQVRLVMSPPSDSSDPDFPELNVLQAGGVQVRVLEEPYIHAKTLLADGKTAFVGSENFTKSSLELNRELGIVFDDAAAVNRLAGAFLQDWNQATPWSAPQDDPLSSVVLRLPRLAVWSRGKTPRATPARPSQSMARSSIPTTPARSPFSTSAATATISSSSSLPKPSAGSRRRRSSYTSVNKCGPRVR